MGFGGAQSGPPQHNHIPKCAYGVTQQRALATEGKKARRSDHRAFLSTGGRSRTGTPLRAPDFESGASTNFATPAGVEAHVTKFFDVGQPQNVIELESLADTNKTVCDHGPQRTRTTTHSEGIRCQPEGICRHRHHHPPLKKMQRHIHLYWDKHAASDLPHSVHPHHSHRPPQRSEFDTAFQARRSLSTGRETNRTFVPGLWGHPHRHGKLHCRSSSPLARARGLEADFEPGRGQRCAQPASWTSCATWWDDGARRKTISAMQTSMRIAPSPRSMDPLKRVSRGSNCQNRARRSETKQLV